MTVGGCFSGVATVGVGTLDCVGPSTRWALPVSVSAYSVYPRFDFGCVSHTHTVGV
ncbi:hypothetical protein PC115_g11686 [Phytophthora cactorum]|uniref:Uncharacterized protein n=1 Tax=Phytophthora cactorum TaxID=29920 RepID=A0A8T1C829_9STRA|nr:hypothetical protein PC115_g11686 [Phytophthora cactorum]